MNSMIFFHERLGVKTLGLINLILNGFNIYLNIIIKLIKIGLDSESHIQVAKELLQKVDRKVHG